MIQGTFGVIQGTFGVIQGTFGMIQMMIIIIIIPLETKGKTLKEI
jgi:hypothetical protein